MRTTAKLLIVIAASVGCERSQCPPCDCGTEAKAGEPEGAPAEEAEPEYYALPGLDHGLMQSPVNILSQKSKEGMHHIELGRAESAKRVTNLGHTVQVGFGEGLETTFDWEWVKFYKTGPGSNVGIVQEGDGAWHQVQDRNAVMLSLVTSEVDAWYARLKDRDDVTVLKPIGDGGGIRSFLLEDPGGYTVEFFQWLESE